MPFCPQGEELVPLTRVRRLVIPHMRRDILSRVPLRQRRVKQAAGDSAHLPSVRTYQAIHPVLECAWIAACCCSVALSGCNLQFFWESAGTIRETFVSGSALPGYGRPTDLRGYWRRILSLCWEFSALSEKLLHIRTRLHLAEPAPGCVCLLSISPWITSRTTTV